MEHNTYERDTLYKEVWRDPMRNVAKRYGISDVMLKKICKQLDVPTPPRGYWAKVKSGQSPKKPSLPLSQGLTQTHGKRGSISLEEERELNESLIALGSEGLRLLEKAAASVDFKERIQLRPSLSSLKKSLDFPRAVRRVNYPENYALEESISRSSANQVFAALETLARTAERVGGAMPEPLRFEILGETISLEISEETRRVEHTITAEEKRELKRYENSTWYKPKFRKWDLEFTGQLKFAVSVGYDHPNREGIKAKNHRLTQKRIPNLSELLAAVFIDLCSACASLREERLRETAELEQHIQQVHAQRTLVEAYNQEVARFRSSLDEAKRHQEACILREYAVALRERGIPEDSEYAAWIENKASWLDPLISANDAVFGSFATNYYPPEPRPLPSGKLPYQLQRFFDREGEEANPSWDRFKQLVDEERPQG